MTNEGELAVALVALLGLAGCSKPSPAPSSEPADTIEPPTTQAPPPSPEPAPPEAPAKATLGHSAPDFTLPDLDGKPTKLSSYKGKFVVLEWFNPGCPFVMKAHGVGSLKGMAKRELAQGDVAWLAINSGAEGRQGYDLHENEQAKQKFGIEHPILRDESGSVGQSYGATNTPHMFVIDKQGVLIYAGAIDNSPDGEGESPEGDKLVNYVADALAAARSGKAVPKPQTSAYGCSVKYAK